jgi:hypothetical protein
MGPKVLTIFDSESHVAAQNPVGQKMASDIVSKRKDRGKRKEETIEKTAMD